MGTLYFVKFTTCDFFFFFCRVQNYNSDNTYLSLVIGDRPKVDVSKSTLSANAPVFVPRSFAPPPQQPQYHVSTRNLIICQFQFRGCVWTVRNILFLHWDFIVLT